MFRLPDDDLRALVVSAMLLGVAVCVAVGVVCCSEESVNDQIQLSDKAINKALNLPDDLLGNPDQAAPQQSSSLFMFDPNEADSATLLRLGLRSWQVRNMLKYRQKGGRWRSPDDFRRLYGLSSEEFERLRPYIRIAPDHRSEMLADHAESKPYGTPMPEEPRFERQEKYAEGTVVQLNQADTVSLKHIPGIGSYYAHKIVKYRERLGGFVSVGQVAEIEGLPAGIVRWFNVEPQPSLRRIRINHATFKELVRHPYLSYEQTKVIVNHIRRYGPLHSWSDLRLYTDFTDKDFERLTPYIVFD